jgi:glycosyltransferase involved in cell wall biosynthesis
MRIGIITTSYPRFAGDSAGHFVASHARFLVEQGHDVEVIAASDDKARDDKSTDIHVTRVPSRGLFYTGGAPDTLERLPLRGALNAASFTARFAFEVAKRARRWDAIIAHWLTPSALAALPSTKPLLAIAHGGDIHTLRRMRLLAPTLFALRARNARLVFVSSDLREIAIAAAPRLTAWLEAATVQPMGIDLARFSAITPALSQQTTLLIVSRLVPVKGVDVALRAFAELADRIDENCELVIAGDGPERASLEILAHQLQIDDRVRFLGEVSTDERDRLLSTAALVIVPSRVLPTGRTEGTPMIALEALASRVPVVASAVGGLKDLAAATLVPPNDPVALADAIDEVLGMGSLPAEDLADLSGAETLEALDWQVVGKRLMPVG